ncbi:MAG: rod shape-determining protein RodA [Ignavibacteria bacterium]|nr:rod shape-determining protein RodA [Ignavibacteria bacterium]
MKFKIKKFWLQTDLKSESVEGKITDKLDVYLFASSLLIVIIGLLSIYSSTLNISTLHVNFYKQLTFAIIGLFVGLIIYYLPLKIFNLVAFPFYIFSIVLLVLVLFLGKKVSGNQAWINIGFFSLQPSEISKFAVILALSNIYARRNFNINSVKGFLIVTSLVLLPTALIVLQKDIGTALVFFSILIFGLFWNGLSGFSVFVLISPIIVGISSILGIIPLIISLVFVIAGLFYFKRELFLSIGILALNISAAVLVELSFHILSPHQINRIKNFLDPNFDPLGSGYNALQAKVAIGSGGLFGKGFLAGSQTQLKFIPAQWTDFIFCVVGEEFGFVGAIFVLLLYFIVISRLLYIAKSTDSIFRSSVVIMTVSVLLTHIFINVGMTIGLVPVIGIPLPLMSYGGSALVTNMSMIATALNFYRHRTSLA